MSNRTLLRSGLALMAVFLLSTSAEAQRRRGGDGGPKYIQGVRGDVHMVLGSGLGVGGRVDIPVAPDGVIDGVDDEIAISPGIEFIFHRWGGRYYYDRYDRYHRRGMAIAPLVTAQWNFYLHPKWSIFPELGLTLIFANYWHYRDDYYDDYRVFPDAVIGFGGRYHINERVSLLMRGIYPFGFNFGITF